MARDRNPKAQQMRSRIAAAAARIMAEDGIDDFALAKRKAARTLGESDARIIFTQILPNALPPIIVIGSMMVGSAILTESALSFLGLGDPNLLSWGSMIGGSRSAMWVAWWTTVLPGLAIMVTVLALNFIGDGLNDALNPRRRG